VITVLGLGAILVIALSAQVFPSFLTRIGGSSAEQGLLLFSMFILYPVSSVAAGIAADRVGKRAVLAAGLAAVAAPFALSAAVPDIRVRTLAVLLFGLGEGAVESQASALLSDLSPDRERSILNWSQVVFSAGAAGGPFLLALLFSLRTGATLAAVLWACSALCAALAAAFLLAARAEGGRGLLPAGGARAGGPSAAAVGSGLRLAGPGLGALAAALFLYVAAEMGTASWLAKYGEIHLGLAPALAPICLTAFWGGLSASRILAGSLSARVPDSLLLYGSLALSLAGQLFSFTVRNPAAALAGFVVTGIGMGAVWPTLVAIAGRRYRQASGTAIGALTASGGLAVAVIQLAIGWLSAPRALGLRATLLALSAFTVANFLVVRRALAAHAVPTAKR
jgi:DHA1 family inner membrane transport protein